jgi:hypothetical protein
LADPAGAHAYRFWDGEAWTARVADRGEEASDPLEGRAFPAPSRWRTMLPTFAGMAAAAAVVGVIALVAVLSRHTPRDTGTFRLRFVDGGAYTVHRVTLQPGETLHAKMLVAGGTVRLGLGIPTKVLEAQPGFPLTVFAGQRRSGAAALLGSTGNSALDKALGTVHVEGTVTFPGFSGWVSPDHAVVRATPPGVLRPGTLAPFTAKVAGTYDVIVIGEQPGARAVLNLHITTGDTPAVDLGSFGNVVQPDTPPSVSQAMQDLLHDQRAPSAGALVQSARG